VFEEDEDWNSGSGLDISFAVEQIFHSIEEEDLFRHQEYL